MSQAAVYLDFQGTLGGTGVDDILTFDFYPCSIAAIRALNGAGVLAIGTTNHSHIARGLVNMEQYEQRLELLRRQLADSGAWLDAVYMCPHGREDTCTCKKPAIGMIDAARRDFDIDRQREYVVGDMGMNDIVMAHNAGAKGILVLTGVGQGSLCVYRHTWAGLQAEYVAPDVLEAVNWICRDLKEN